MVYLSQPISLSKASADLERMIREFNVEPIERIVDRMPKNRLLEMGIIIAHRDFDKILEEYEKGKKFAIVSGRGPSGPIHLGHIFVFMVVKYLQDAFDAEVFIPLSEDEKFIFDKISSLEEGASWAYDNARTILALGFKKNKTHLYVSSKQRWVYQYALMISKKLTLSTVKNALGISDSVNIGIPFYAAVQIAHILQPTIDKGVRVVVPIGLDQDVFMRLTRDVAEKLGLVKPASLYVKFIPGINREPMSSSRPETAIYVTDDEETLWRKIFNTFTGGKGTLEEQRRYGADPYVCNIYEWLKTFVFKTKKEVQEHLNKCQSGELICGFDCKAIIFRYLKDFIKSLREKAEKINLEEYMMV